MPGLLVVLILLYILWRLIVGSSPKASPDTVSEDLVQDPVCGLYLPESEAVKARIHGEDVFFCSEACKKAFLENPKPPGSADGA